MAEADVYGGEHPVEFALKRHPVHRELEALSPEEKDEMPKKQLIKKMGDIFYTQILRNAVGYDAQPRSDAEKEKAMKFRQAVEKVYIPYEKDHDKYFDEDRMMKYEAKRQWAEEFEVGKHDINEPNPKAIQFLEEMGALDRPKKVAPLVLPVLPPQQKRSDPRYPNPNKTRACWDNFIDFQRCIKLKGKEHEPCMYFREEYQNYCFIDDVREWYSQIHDGTFPVKI